MKYLLLFVFVACSQPLEKIGKRKMSFDEFVAQNGMPDTQVVNELDSSKTMLVYKDQTVQMSDQLIDAKFRNPSVEEKNIQYWRHKLSDCPYVINDVSNENDHEKSYSLVCDQNGITVFFNEKGSVTRVVEKVEVVNE